jgi:hypothetical protein
MMTVLLFILGIIVATRLVAALYGIIDLAYAWSSYWLPIGRRIVFWIVSAGGIYLLCPAPYHLAFGAGVVFFVVFHCCIYWVGKILVQRMTNSDSID